MARCSRLCWLRVLSVTSGLVATSFLLVSIFICTWIDISEIKPLGFQERPVDTLQPEKALELKQSPTLPPEESSGEVDELLVVHGRVTTWPGPTAGTEEYYLTLKRSTEVGLWWMCMKKSYMKWKRKFERLKFTEMYYEYKDNLDNGTKCWGMNPFKHDLLPGEEGVQKVSSLIRIAQSQHFNLPLFTSLGLIVIAILVTSGGLAKNNAIILVGAALYEFSCLVLTVSLMWFFPLMYYAELPLISHHEPYIHYFGPENIIQGTDGPKAQIRHFFGPGLYFGFGAFIFINMAAAAAVATYRLTANKASHHRLIRREREAVRKANRQWLVTRL